MANENFKYLLQDDTGQAINTTLTALKNVIENKSTDVPAWVTAALALPTAQKNALKSAIYEVLGLNNSAQTSAQALPDIYSILDLTVDESNGAAVHNSLFRGKNLGESLTNEQAANIANGTFKGLWVGDYWEKEMTYSYPDANNGDATASRTDTVRMVIGHNDYKLWTCGSGSLRCTTHHALIVPHLVNQSCFFFAPMNATATNAGGYIGSKMVSTYLPACLTIFNNFFGSGHILEYSNIYINAVTDGYGTGYANYNRKIDLFNGPMVFGHYAHPLYSVSANKGYCGDYDIRQVALLGLTNRYSTIGWLRTHCKNGQSFHHAHDAKYETAYGASAVTYFKPFVCIK